MSHSNSYEKDRRKKKKHRKNSNDQETLKNTEVTDGKKSGKAEDVASSQEIQSAEASVPIENPDSKTDVTKEEGMKENLTDVAINGKPKRQKKIRNPRPQNLGKELEDLPEVTQPIPT